MALLKDFNYQNEAEALQYFGLLHEEIESAISSLHLGNEESYVGHGLTAEALYTSFADYHQMLTHPLIKSSDRFVDVGAGICKGSLLAQALNLPIEVVSLELVSERVEAAKAAANVRGFKTNSFIQSDLLRDKLPKAKHYFIYLPTGILLTKVLRELGEYAREFDFHVWCIESHGDLVPTLKNLAPWLELESDQDQLFSLRHDPSLYIFKSTQRREYARELFQFQNKLCHELSQNMSDAQIVVSDRDLGGAEDYQWLASIEGLSMGVRPGTLQAHYPDREFAWDKIENVLCRCEKKYAHWIKARAESTSFANLGEVRKIIISPTARIEFSSGARLNLEEADSLWS